MPEKSLNEIAAWTPAMRAFLMGYAADLLADTDRKVHPTPTRRCACGQRTANPSGICNACALVLS